MKLHLREKKAYEQPPNPRSSLKKYELEKVAAHPWYNPARLPRLEATCST